LITQRTDQPQFGPNGHATAPDIPRVLRNIGLIQDHMQERFSHVYFAAANRSATLAQLTTFQKAVM
jgi:hypothetical protein